MRRILVTLPDEVIDQIDQQASDLFVSRNTLLTWKILGMDSEIGRAARSRSDKPQDKISALKA